MWRFIDLGNIHKYIYEEKCDGEYTQKSSQQNERKV